MRALLLPLLSVPTWLAVRLALRRAAERCGQDHYAPFLRRRVRCELKAGHHAQHRHDTFDETTVWT